MGKDEDATAGATESRDVQDFQEDAEKRRGASFEEEAAGVLKSDPATDVEGADREQKGSKSRLTVT